MVASQNLLAEYKRQKKAAPKGAAFLYDYRSYD